MDPEIRNRWEGLRTLIIVENQTTEVLSGERRRLENFITLGFKFPAQFRLAKKSGAVEASGSIIKLNLKCQATAA